VVCGDWRRVLELTQARFKVGYAAKPDVSARETWFEATQIQAIETRLKRANPEHASAILTGDRPIKDCSPGIDRLTVNPRVNPELRLECPRANSIPGTSLSISAQKRNYQYVPVGMPRRVDWHDRRDPVKHAGIV
jgi:outer membrane protein TolC